MSYPKTTNEETYEETVDVEFNSMIAGKGKETTTLTKLIEGQSILKAFVEDIDIQEITVVSNSIGFIRTYRKRFKKREQATHASNHEADHETHDPDFAT